MSGGGGEIEELEKNSLRPLLEIRSPVPVFCSNEGFNMQKRDLKTSVFIIPSEEDR